MISLKKKRLILSSLNKTGAITYIGLILTTIIVSILASSFMEWYVDTNKKVRDLSSGNRFISAFYDFGNKIKNADYAGLKEKEGKSFTEDLGDFILSQAYSNEGLFKDGKCDTTVSEKDLINGKQKCMNVTYSIEEKITGKKQSTTLTRHSTQVDAVPLGTITYYGGAMDKIPSGWQLCDGTNGTPDMRDTFIMGTTNQSAIGQITGSNWYQLKPENLPSTSILIRSNTQKIIDEGNGKNYTFYSPVKDLTGLLDTRFCDVGSGGYVYFNYMSATVKVSDWQGVPIEKQPPYYKLAYIMRIK